MIECDVGGAFSLLAELVWLPWKVPWKWSPIWLCCKLCAVCHVRPQQMVWRNNMAVISFIPGVLRGQGAACTRVMLVHRDFKWSLETRARYIFRRRNAFWVSLPSLWSGPAKEAIGSGSVGEIESCMCFLLLSSTQAAQSGHEVIRCWSHVTDGGLTSSIWSEMGIYMLYVKNTHFGCYSSFLKVHIWIYWLFLVQSSLILAIEKVGQC